MLAYLPVGSKLDHRTVPYPIPAVLHIGFSTPQLLAKDISPGFLSEAVAETVAEVELSSASMKIHAEDRAQFRLEDLARRISGQRIDDLQRLGVLVPG